MSAPRCLVTGANGYLGAQVAAKLRAEGWRVAPMTRNPAGGGGVRFALGEPVDVEKLRGHEALIHCAYDFSPVRWKDILAVNVEGSARLFDAAEAAGVKSIVVISTISAYDACVSQYGRAKLLIEARAREGGACIVRPGLIYGDAPGAMFGRLVAQVRAAPLVPIPGDGRQLMYTVHQEDLVEAIWRGLSAGPAGPVTVAHEQPIAFRDLLSAIGARLGRKVTPVPTPWRAMWLGLRGAELVGVRIGLRSDSLVSLVHQDKAPHLNAAAALGVRCRPFSLDNVAL